MSVASLAFLSALFAGSAVFPKLPTLWVRRLCITVGSALFLWSLVPDTTHMGTLLAFVLSGYMAARVLAVYPSTALLATYLTLLIGVFVVLKRYAVLRLLAGNTLFEYGIDIVGLSFILFRQIHYVVDAKQGQIPLFTIWGYLCYQPQPFTLLAGPIQRYQRFHEDWKQLVPQYTDPHDLRMTFLRILLGVIKVAFIGEVLLWLAMQRTGLPTPWAQAVHFYLYPAYVYCNFAGYCDIVIAGASLVGMHLPENFHRPYLARNMIDFWTRWHRSLSFWIRDYIFTPTYLAIARRRPARASSLAFLCYFLALFVAGVWHGASWNFVVFGVLNGIGVSAAKWWENRLLAYYGRPGLRTYLTSRPMLLVARLATFHFVCLTMVFLQPESTHRWLLWLDRIVQV